MDKYKTIILALFAVLAFSAVAATSASAEQWLHEGKAITSPIAGLVDGSTTLEHKGGLTGNSTVECTGQGHGTFGPGTADTVTETLGLKGEKTDIDCETVSGACGAKELELATSLHLPWKSELILLSGSIWDLVTESGGKGLPGVEKECDHLKIKVICEGSGRAKFISNGTNGAIFETVGAESLQVKCNDGGTATTTGRGEALGFTIS